NLNQLSSFTRGSHTQSWALDGQGNWSTFTDVTNGVTTTQTRSHNVQNQITSLTSNPPGPTTPGYDFNGSTTLDQNNKTLVYDAWNRLVSYGGAGGVSYGYDALNRRITSSPAGVITNLYYSSFWQVLEEQNNLGVTQAQYVWSPVYVDAMVERDVGA